MSTESTTTPTPVKKKDKILGMDTEDIALGLGAVAAAGVAILGWLKLQEMAPKPPAPAPANQLTDSRVTYAPQTPPVNQGVVATTTGGGVIEHDPLGPNSNSLNSSDLMIDRDKLARTRGIDDRINAGY